MTWTSWHLIGEIEVMEAFDYYGLPPNYGLPPVVVIHVVCIVYVV